MHLQEQEIGSSARATTHQMPESGIFVLPDEIIIEIVLKLHPVHDFRLACTRRSLAHLMREAKVIRFKAFTNDALNGNEQAIEMMALCYENGNGVDRDVYQANILYEELAVRGCSIHSISIERYITSAVKNSRGIGSQGLTTLMVERIAKAAQLPLSQISTKCLYRISKIDMKHCYLQPMGPRGARLCKEAASRDYTKAFVLLGHHYLNHKPSRSAAYFSVAAKRGNEDARFFDTLLNVEWCSDKFAAVFTLIKSLLETKNIKKPQWRMASRILELMEKYCPSHGQPERFPNQLETIDLFLQRAQYQIPYDNSQRLRERIGDWYANGSGPVPRQLDRALYFYGSADTQRAQLCAKIANVSLQLENIPNYFNWLQRAVLKAHEPSHELLCEYQNTLKSGRGYTKVLPKHHEAVWFKLITEARMGEAYFYLARMMLHDRPQAEYEQPTEAPQINNLRERWFCDNDKGGKQDWQQQQQSRERASIYEEYAFLRRHHRTPPTRTPTPTAFTVRRWQFALRLLGSPRCKVPSEHQQEYAAMKAQMHAMILVTVKEELAAKEKWDYQADTAISHADQYAIDFGLAWCWSPTNRAKIEAKKKQYEIGLMAKKRWRDILRPWLALCEQEMSKVSAAERERKHHREVEVTRAVLQRIQDNAHTGVSTKCRLIFER
eukprot:TRINITY_DN2369_c0_g2_i1.p1 TRINITY_DN2369_c0_g2~~TRINITY_DN2369_c0_g2_i1.p1  ORF type:complete len:666 (+),score=94.65 TRINITY_DN2369_c0_g2_i1:143-2140(+)